MSEQEIKQRPQDFKLIEFLFMKQVKLGNSKTNFTGDIYGKTIPRFELLDVNLTVIEVKRLLFAKLKHIYKADSPLAQSEAENLDEEINKSIAF